MESILQGRRTLFFTVALAVLICVASVGGLSLGTLYAREAPDWAVQCIGQDIIDLALLVPTLLISLLCMRRGMKPALFVWLGATIYSGYTFFIYAFSVHFNQFFLVYCAVLGLSVYATIATIVATDFQALTGWFDERRSLRLASTFLFMLAVLFCLLWLEEIVPATLRNDIPLPLKNAGLPTNPVHVLDLSLLLPGFIIVSILLRKKHPYGYLFAPVFIAFAALMDVTIGALMVIMALKGLPASIPMVGAFAVLAVISVLIFAGLVKRTPD
jgi:hypothetical protein